jgi:hypothetical protein
MDFWNILRQTLRVGAVILLAILILSSSNMPPGDLAQRARAFTRQIEFDFVGWTLDALRVKLGQYALGSDNYISSDSQHQLVVDYLGLIHQIQRVEAQLNVVFADPNISDPQSASADLRTTLDDLYAQRDQVAPVAEAILQTQLSSVASDLDLTIGGQPIPPVLYHSTALPWALIISPRDEIRQEADISLIPDITVDQHVVLEKQVDGALDVSSLVVGIGGIGLYPTMINQTSNINWLTEVIAHEWTHNILSLRPLGLNYFTSPELRTMNETAASIAGKEIGLALIERYYPEFVPPPPPPPLSDSDEPGPAPEPPVFDFRAEMHATRVNVDKLLEDGKIEEAELYMEVRRKIFWENGYLIRKLNQAYFAFYGAYADLPGGAAGEDPVGAAVRELRARSDSLADFLNTMSWMTSFDQLERAVKQRITSEVNHPIRPNLH